MNDTPLPLSRFTVLDLTLARAGPTCVRHLADWGAKVIRVEQPPSTGDQEEVLGRREGVDFQNLHRNKQAITLNLKSDRGREIFYDLVRRADVVVENMRPGAKHRLKIDYDTLAAINPRIVYGSISGFGQDGPYADHAGLDQIAQGLGGLMSITGDPDHGPMRVGIPISDLAAGAFLAQGVLIALLDRDVSGRGRWVTTSLIEALIGMLDFQAARWLVRGDLPKQEGNWHPTMSPTGVFEAKDGRVNIAASGPRLFERLCRAIGADDLLEREEFATSASRSKHRDTLNAEISRRTRVFTAADLIDRLQASGVPCGPIYTIEQTFADPQVRHLGMSRPVDHPTLGRMNLVAQPFNISGVSKDLRAPTPGVGEHTDAVLESLGLSREDIAELRKKGVV